MPGDIPKSGLEGQIAFAKRRVIRFQSKVENVFDAGAVGLVIYNNLPGIFQGALASESKFSVISIPGEDGDAIVDVLDDPDAEASITLTLEDRPS